MPYNPYSPYMSYPSYQPPAYGAQYAPAMPQGTPMQTPTLMTQTYAAPSQMPVNVPMSTGLAGQFVDGIDVVKATNAATDGSPMFFPTRDLKAIFMKQMQMDGSTALVKYVPEVPETPETQAPQPSVGEIVDGKFASFRKDISDMFAELGDDINDRLDKIEKQVKARTSKSEDK